MPRFAELGAPFPLFEAPVDDADAYLGSATCALCDKKAAVCFELGIGASEMRVCPTCRMVVGSDGEETVDCHACRNEVPFPERDEPIVACYACLRQGRAAITKDTELGMVSWEQAVAGVTLGIPGLRHPDFELVPKEGSDWIGVRLPQATMFELLRTPTYATIQGERWLFCCKAPMIFVGQWSAEEFSRESKGGDGRALFDAIVEKPVPGLWEDELHDQTGIYVFRCAACGRRRAHWDIA